MAGFEFEAELWEHDGPGSWHFVSLPAAVADDLSDAAADRTARPGFGAVPVDVTIGATTWSTSVFPDRKRGTYVLPVKKAVRVAESLAAGSVVPVRVVAAIDRW